MKLKEFLLTRKCFSSLFEAQNTASRGELYVNNSMISSHQVSTTKINIGDKIRIGKERIFIVE
jgi:predicted rRNA methylase YqxC with S4 and FtsJ domains